jgi:hypothetical protein
MFFTGLIFLKNTHFLYQSGSLKLRIRFAVCTIRCTVSYLCKLHHKMSFCMILNRGENRNVCIYPEITGLLYDFIRILLKRPIVTCAIQSDQKENKSELALQIIGHVVAEFDANKCPMHGRRQFVVSNFIISHEF